MPKEYLTLGFILLRRINPKSLFNSLFLNVLIVTVI